MQVMVARTPRHIRATTMRATSNPANSSYDWRLSQRAKQHAITNAININTPTVTSAMDIASPLVPIIIGPFNTAPTGDRLRVDLRVGDGEGGSHSLFTGEVCPRCSERVDVDKALHCAHRECEWLWCYKCTTLFDRKTRRWWCLSAHETNAGPING